MHEDLQHLVLLSDADEVLLKAKERLAAARAAVGSATTVRDAAAAARDAAKAALDAAKSEERQLNRKVEQYEARRNTATRALETGAGDADAAERQVLQTNDILDETETSILEVMERQEALAAVLKAKEAALADAESVLAAATEAAPGAIAETTAAAKAATAERDRLRVPVPKHLFNHYERVRERKRKPLVRLIGRTCPVCQIMIGAARVSELKRGVIAMLSCPGCKRMVALPDED